MEKTKSWFCVFNNPQEIYEGEPHEVAEKALEDWVKDHPTRTGAVAYCISKDGLIHLHMVLEDSHMARFSALKNTYPKAHLEPTKGTKEQAEDYIQKRGKFEDKYEQVLYIARYGEIKGNQGARKDFDIIEELLEQGLTPRQIMEKSFAFRRYDKMIKDAHYRIMEKKVPTKRDVKAYWHVGASGSGKSYTFVQLAEMRGEDAIYFLTDYEHGFDKYSCEPVLFMDEFRGRMPFSQLLVILDGYKAQVPCRYMNVLSLWDEVHITSVLPPELIYKDMVEKYQRLDTYEQLRRRIDVVVYHWIDEDGKYRQYEVPMADYETYEKLKYDAENQISELPLIEMPF